jgi:hypothetical protein
VSALPAEVVSLRNRAGYRPDLAAIASAQVAAARAEAGLSPAAFAGWLGTLLAWEPTAAAVMSWEGGMAPPGDVLLACSPGAQAAAPALPLLAAVTPAFPAEALIGPWVTTYVFIHAGRPHYHADIAQVTAAPDGRVLAVNHPPEPRSQGRRKAFRNEIEARLAGRHLIGEWQNTSDFRYHGGLHLAVLPGEMVMQGYYTGVGSDIEVSQGAWTWVRLEPDEGLADITLRDPAELHELVMGHAQPDEPLTLADIGEDC